MSRLSPATSIFLDLYPLGGREESRMEAGRPDLRLLGEVSYRFVNLPWENLTKFLKKHQPDREERGPDGDIGADAGRELREDRRPGDEPEAGHGRDRAIARLRRSEEVLIDHARLGTGGTCFSLTNALRRIVTDAGFRAYPAMADMRHGANIHCGLVVAVEGERYLLDPGYLVPEPVRIRPDATTRVELPGHRLEYRPVPGTGEIELWTANDRGETVFRYRMRPRPIPEADFVRFWLESFDAPGMNSLHLNRLASEGRLSAHNLNLRIDGGGQKTNVKLRESYVDEIAARFGLDRVLVRRAFESWERHRCRG